MIVTDTNVIAYFYLEGERSEKVFEKDPHWVAPLLWQSEFRSILALYMRKCSLSVEQAQQIMQAAMLLMKEREYEIVSGHVLELVAVSGCSVYDCEFVALAEDLRLPLVTIDKKILSEFPQVAVSPDDF